MIRRLFLLGSLALKGKIDKWICMVLNCGSDIFAYCANGKVIWNAAHMRYYEIPDNLYGKQYP